MQTSPNIQPESTSKEQKLNRDLLIGSIVFFCGILAFIIPQALVPSGSGDTEGAWIAGFTALCLGIPLLILGLILLVVAVIRFGKKDKNARGKPVG